MITCFQKLLELHKLCNFQSNEGSKVGPASNSEIKRWFNQRCVEINHNTVAFDDPCPVIERLVLFPNNKKKRTTLIWNESVTFVTIDEKILKNLNN